LFFCSSCWCFSTYLIINNCMRAWWCDITLQCVALPIFIEWLLMKLYWVLVFRMNLNFAFNNEGINDCICWYLNIPSLSSWHLRCIYQLLQLLMIRGILNIIIPVRNSTTLLRCLSSMVRIDFVTCLISILVSSSMGS
jgi:hypothetical protein